MIHAALIDLDGTLLDTAPDLAAAANRMLAALGMPARSVQEVGNYVGKGIARLVERALTGDLEKKADRQLLDRALALFSGFYDAESGRHCSLYPGVAEGLQALKASRLQLACVTNKAKRFTMPLLARMELAGYFDTTVCADEVARGKPRPDCYLRACEQLGLAPAESIAIGDSENDVLAARAAGIRVLCVSYGYREGRAVEALGADAIVADLRDAAEVIKSLGAAGKR